MGAQQKFLAEGKDQGVRKLYVELSVTCTSLSNVTASAYTAFGRAFAATPRVIGVNCDRKACIITAIPTTAGVSLYVEGYKDGVKPDGAVLASAVLEEYLA